MLKEYSMAELLRQAGGGSIAQAVLKDQAEQDGVSRERLMEDMAKALEVMRQAAREGLTPGLRSVSGMTGGQAPQYKAWVEKGGGLGGQALGQAGAIALGVAELNACMGRIVAAPTAGACGVLPGVLLALEKQKGYTGEQLVMALFTAAGVGEVIAHRASIAGAEGGCQAEVGAAAAMAAAAAVELAGGQPQQAAAAVSMALMNLMGLVCDPVGGLVEVPCVYRNVAGAAVALTAADMALAGIAPILPADEVIDAMGRVGRMMPAGLRETGEEGCAACPSGGRFRSPSF